MEIGEILQAVSALAKSNGISTPYLCGGIPRDKALGILKDMEDIDLTTGDDSVHQLAKLVATHFKGNLKVMPDGHGQVYIDGKKLDFSSNYRAPGIEEMLKKAGAEPTDMMLELYSRDFTVNALLMTLDLKTIKDPTGLGMTDIKKKRLRTCLPARMTLGNDHKRVVRVLYLAAKLGFDVDESIIEWVKANPGTIADCKPKYLASKLQQAMNYDEKKTVELLGEMGLWPHIPALPSLIPYMSKGRM